MNALLTILKIAGSLGLFLYGIKKLSEGLQKTAGKKMKSILHFMTGNRILAVTTGLLITALINSSSATTVMVVSFVNAGLMNLTQAIGVILGANIGTTITGWIVALIGFSMDTTILSLAFIGIGTPLMFMKKAQHREIGEMLMGFGMLFLGLEYLRTSMPDISSNVETLSFLARMNSGSVGTILLCVLIGLIVTMIIQSSSAAMAITLTLAYQGWVGVTAACALVLGQNIGTTITAFLASIGTSTNAKRAAWAHILFNLIGSILAIILLGPMMRFINSITPGDIYTMTGTALNQSLPTYLAMFHTFFNVANTLIFLPFINLFAKLICKIIPNRQDYDQDTYHFKYVGSPVVDTPEMYLLALRDEIRKMSNLASDMFRTYREVFNNPQKDMSEQVMHLKKQEDYADQMQEQLTALCVHLIEDAPATSSATTLNCLIRVIDELESITDSCCNLILLSEKRYNNEWEMDRDTFLILDQYEALVMNYLEYIHDRMDRTFTKAEMDKANDFETQVNERRNTIGDIVYTHLSSGGRAIPMELWTLDVIKHLEHIGDYCTNIAETYHRAVKHTPVLQKKAKI